ncbi:MAG: Rab family GTPase [archaeon]|nr:Rab family GTPase [archaeon]
MSSNEYKVVTIGESSVGKSAIVFRCVHPEEDITGQTQPTIAVAFAVKRVTTPSGQVVPLNLWDTAGSERFRSITRMYFKGSVAALLVFSLTSMESFEAATSYWIAELERHVDPSCCILLVGNKKDLVEERQVPFERASFFAQSRNIPYLEVSAKTGENIEDMFLTISQKVVQTQGPPAPVPDKANSSVPLTIAPVPAAGTPGSPPPSPGCC